MVVPSNPARYKKTAAPSTIVVSERERERANYKKKTTLTKKRRW